MITFSRLYFNLLNKYNDHGHVKHADEVFQPGVGVRQTADGSSKRLLGLQNAVALHKERLLFERGKGRDVPAQVQGNNSRYVQEPKGEVHIVAHIYLQLEPLRGERRLLSGAFCGDFRRPGSHRCGEMCGLPRHDVHDERDFEPRKLLFVRQHDH